MEHMQFPRGLAWLHVFLLPADSLLARIAPPDEATYILLILWWL